MCKMESDPNLFKYIFEVDVLDKETFRILAAECIDLMVKCEGILQR